MTHGEGPKTQERCVQADQGGRGQDARHGRAESGDASGGGSGGAGAVAMASPACAAGRRGTAARSLRRHYSRQSQFLEKDPVPTLGIVN